MTDEDAPRPFSITVRAATEEECEQTDGMANHIDGAAAIEVDGVLVGITNEYGTCCFPLFVGRPPDGADVSKYERIEQLAELATVVWSGVERYREEQGCPRTR